MLYRRHSQGPSWAAAAAALLVALAAGFAGGRFSAPSPDLRQRLEPARELLMRASGALEIAALEYQRREEGNEAGRKAAREAVSRAAASIEQAGPVMSTLYPVWYGRTRQAASVLSDAVSSGGDAAAVLPLIRRLQADLDALPPVFRLGPGP